ncbi:MAG: SAM-dependent chlorinase/fluorinase [Elusimicrobia bacterium]|nr:SAM-dependent chlorinase/fluorinase [Elusimicrobiota bacterium]
MKAPFVALLTDFGHADPFVGVMKGVILSRCPWARVIDLCHGVAPQDVRAAAFQLRCSVPYFHDGTLFVCVVDPGVGSKRPILWARGERHSFLAPDNGLLSWVGPLREVRRVEDSALFLKPVSRTFHGRDVFAPVAGALAAGADPARLGPRAKPEVRWSWPEPKRAGKGWRGKVVAVDGFGNAVTNLRPEHLKGRLSAWAAGRRFPLRSCYADAPDGAPLAVLGSAGLIELSLGKGNLFGSLRVLVGDTIHVR